VEVLISSWVAGAMIAQVSDTLEVSDTGSLLATGYRFLPLLPSVGSVRNKFLYC
jgi:hypothetical protein